MQDTQEIAKIFARCFKGTDGELALAHLRSLTFERCFGPETSPEVLRYMEGQKHLLSHIEALISRGREP